MATSSVTSAATSSLVTALGGGSGIDMTALANSLAEAQFAAKAERLSVRSETLERQISTASNLKSMMLNLAASLGERVRAGDLSPQPTVANSAVARATLSGSSQPRGSYSLEVTALATGQVLTSPASAAPTAPVGSGTLTLRFGTVAGSAFAEDAAHPPVTLNIASGATLSDVASAINAAGAGVTAYVANAADGARLVLKGAEGAVNGFILEAAETPGDPGLSGLAWNPASGASNRLLNGAANASFKIDGLAMTAPSNSVANAVPGVTLALTGTNAGAPTTLSLADPSSAITGAMQDLTAALNEIAGEIRSATDPLSGELARDSGARQLKQAFAALAGTIVMPGAAAGTPRTLADLGLATQRDGSFVLDTKRLSATLKSDPQGAAAMFTNGLYGVYATVDGMARKASKSSDPGTLAGSVGRYSQLKARLADDQAKIADRQDALRTQLVKRFAAADTRVGASKSTLSFLQNQIDAWNAQRD
jgi:flagellar hook-associated protein 2